MIKYNERLTALDPDLIAGYSGDELQLMLDYFRRHVRRIVSTLAQSWSR